MVFKLPDLVEENEQDDIQSVDFDIDSLSRKFIDPIDAIRSISAPAILDSSKTKDEDGFAIQRELNTANVNSSDVPESRAHAFYRLIGFPVIDINFRFYNPGFNPFRTKKVEIKNENISGNISPEIRLMTRQREFNARSRLATFQKGGVNSSVYGLALPIIKEFQLIDTNKDFTIQDNQSFALPKRRLFIESNYQQNDGEDITNFFDSGTHILRPFVVDPIIERTVMPQDRIVTEPFLETLNDTQIEEEVILTRPGIEFILRLRLRQNQSEEATLQEAAFALDPSANISGLSLTDLRRVALALLNDNKIADQEIINRLTINNTELFNINKLIKTIKAVIDILVRSIEDISQVTKNINWVPLPNNILGPEINSNLGNFITPKFKNSELERRISQLRIKSFNSRRQDTVSDEEIGTFVFSIFENTEKLFTNELTDAIEQKNEFSREGSNALKTIELITGEVSGLGLVDILAIYTAMWAVDIDVLLSMIDESAFERLFQFNVDLRNTNVVDRRSNGPKFGIFDAIQQFEKQVINILSFADRLVELRLASPRAEEGGTL